MYRDRNQTSEYYGSAFLVSSHRILFIVYVVFVLAMYSSFSLFVGIQRYFWGRVYYAGCFHRHDMPPLDYEIGRHIAPSSSLPVLPAPSGFSALLFFQTYANWRKSLVNSALSDKYCLPNVLVWKPDEGFGNRMMQLSNALVFAYHTNRVIFIDWEKPFSFLSFFEDLTTIWGMFQYQEAVSNGIVCVSSYVPHKSIDVLHVNDPSGNTVDKYSPPSKIAPFVFLCGFQGCFEILGYFNYPVSFNIDALPGYVFRPGPSVLKHIAPFDDAIRPDSSWTFGAQIRSEYINPGEEYLWYCCYNALKRKLPATITKTRFFLTTENEEVALEFSRHLGNELLYLSKTIVHTHDSQNTPAVLDSFEKTFADIFMLSRSHVLVYTNGSTFGSYVGAMELQEFPNRLRDSLGHTNGYVSRRPVGEPATLPAFCPASCLDEMWKPFGSFGKLFARK
eukprot:ANDGO_06439.mRNA.1 hypothetical protein